MDADDIGKIRRVMGREFYWDGNAAVEDDGTRSDLQPEFPRPSGFVPPPGYYENLEREKIEDDRRWKWHCEQLERYAQARLKLTGSRYVKFNRPATA